MHRGLARCALTPTCARTPRVLAAYDLFVLRFSNRLVWRCPWPRLLDHYDRHVGASHLDACAVPAPVDDRANVID